MAGAVEKQHECPTDEKMPDFNQLLQANIELQRKLDELTQAKLEAENLLVSSGIAVKRDQDALQRAKEEWERTFDSVPDLIAIMDDQHRIIRFNKAMAERMQTIPDQDLEQLCLFTPHSLGEQTAVPFKVSALTDTATQDAELLEECADGDYSVTTTPLTDESGKQVGTVYIARDVSMHRRAEEALRKTEEQVRRKLESILTPDGDIGELDFGDIIDVRSLQSLMDDFYPLTNTPATIIDLKGNVLVGVGWQEICLKFHRVHPETCRNCIESDIALSEGVPQGEYKLYKCKNNMWDVATPIIFGGRHLANLFMGQFFFDDEIPDYDLFRAQAKQYGFDEDEYIAALDRVPRVNRQFVSNGMAYFMKFADIFSRLSYSNVMLARLVSERDCLMASLKKTAERLNLLAGTSSRLLACESPHQVVDDLCHEVMAYLDCDIFFHFFADEGQGRLRLKACAGISEDEAKRIEWLDYGSTVCGCAARDACRIVAEDIAATSDPHTDLVKSYDIQAYACHPLLAQGLVLGTLSFGTRTRPRFSDEDLSLMKAVADQVAMAIERKRAEEDLRRAHDELEHRVAERTEELATTIDLLGDEIIERQKAQQKIHRLNQLYAVLSETNKSIVRASDRGSLFSDICHIAVYHGGFKLAWIGLVEAETGRVLPVASAGATRYLEEILVSRNDEPNGKGPTGRAIREGTYYICNDFQSDPSTQPWHEKGRLHGMAASASIAIAEEARVVGALTLYANEKDFFDPQHVELLQRLGADISFALDNMEREAHRRRTEQALQEETLERLRAVEALREKEQLLIQQSRLAAMGEMMSNIAHQWRQPLNVLGLIVQELPLMHELGAFTHDYLTTKVEKSMEVIYHMSQTIDDFRSFFKPNKEKMNFSVADVVASALSLIGGSMKNQEVGIEVKINPASDFVICGYQNEYSQVIINILINARDAFETRKVSTPRIVRIHVGAEEDRTIVTISDNAGGIPEEILPKIFDPYFTTKGSQGTGIGLFMAKTIIESNMNGRLTVRNVDLGAEFRIVV